MKALGMCMIQSPVAAHPFTQWTGRLYLLTEVSNPELLGSELEYAYQLPTINV